RATLVRVRTQRVRALAATAEARADPPHAPGARERVLPLVVHVAGGVEACPGLAVEAAVGPGLVRVAGEQQPVGDVEPAVVRRERVGRAVELLGRHGRLRPGPAFTARCGSPTGPGTRAGTAC